jgi:hypothetical protein
MMASLSRWMSFFPRVQIREMVAEYQPGKEDAATSEVPLLS